MKKILKVSITFILLAVCFSSVVLAADGTTTLDKVEEPICTIETDYFKFEKQMIKFNKENKELEIQLKVQNKQCDETSNYLAGEFMLVIDNSNSTLECINSNTYKGTRRQAIMQSSTELATKLMEKYPNIKIGVVSFSSLDSVKGETEGTINDAKLITNPTSNKDDVLKAINTIATGNVGPRTNIEAGVTIAQDAFSKDAKIKNMVIVSDGIPNNAVGGPTLTYSRGVAEKTKAKLQEIKDSGTNIFTILTGINEQKVETQTGKTYKELATEIFGTTENPNYGKFFMVDDSQINDVLCNNVYTYVTETIHKPVKDLVIYDYFPQEIIDNFEFEFVQQPTKGTISPVINSDRALVWKIDSLEPREIATVQYKLKLKENYNKEIVDKILSTNEKVDIEYNNKKETSDVTPKVVVHYTEPTKEQPENKQPEVKQPETKEPDKTVAPTVLPQTGEVSIISGIVLTAISSIGLYIKNRKFIIK